MNEKMFKVIDRNKSINKAQDFLTKTTEFNEIQKIHQKTTWHFPESNNLPMEPALIEWLSLVQNTDVLPSYTEKSIKLKKDDENDNISLNQGSVRDYKKDFTLPLDTLGELMFKAFGRCEVTSSKIYPSAGGLYPVIPIVIILNKNQIPGLDDNGCYIYNSSEHELILQKGLYSDVDLEKFKKFVVTDWEHPNFLMAYAIDLKRAITKYKARGYRHALIEVGLMAQSFKNTLLEYDIYGECCWSGFSDNALTNFIGLSPRLAPVALLQWFGEKNVV